MPFFNWMVSQHGFEKIQRAKTILGKKCSVEIYVDEDIKCCATKASPIRKIEAIKIVNEDGEMITDFKQVYNKEFNDLVNVYHLCLKYVVV